MSAGNEPVSRFGFQPGMVVQELGWDEDIDEGLRAQIEATVTPLPPTRSARAQP